MEKNTVHQTADQLKKLLADSYMLYLKTHSFHWNVKGPMFSTLHQLFELEYTELAIAIDEIAERIRALGYSAPGTFREFSEITSIVELPDLPHASDMIRILADDQKIIVQSAHAAFNAAEASNDPASADLAVRRIDLHEKNAWMLKSHLE